MNDLAASSEGEVQRFYNAFDRHLLNDLWMGNPRAEAAMRYVIQKLPASAHQVLEIGFGSGWTAFEMARANPQRRVTAVDISPRLKELAETLFPHDRVNYLCRSVNEPLSVDDHSVNAVVMVDVYEHVPKASRNAFHRELARVLRPDGVVLLTCPTVKHQRWLMEHRPDGLQPVDELIDRPVVEQLASDIGGTVAEMQEQRIWREGDYFHAALIRGSAILDNAHPPVLKTTDALRQRISERLGVRVFDGILIANRGDLKVCLATPSPSHNTQTFVRAHIERLPARIRVLHGGLSPGQTDDGRFLQPRRITHRVWRKLVRRVFKVSDEEQYSRAVARYLREERFDVVLAEFGQTGHRLLRACELSGVPLVVHFHGYDAFVEDEVEACVGYRKMFKQAAGIIAVSRHMQQHLIDLGAPPEKVTLATYGSSLSEAVEANPGHSEPHLLAVGRFTDKKCPHLTLTAFARVLVEVPDAQLTMIGSGPLLGPCRALATALNINHAVTFAGVKTHKEVGDMMQQVRAFVQHSAKASNGDCEGTPLAVLEAQHAGLPVIATRHAGIPDVVIDGETGFLCDELDIDTMAEAMRQVLIDPSLAARIGTAGRARVGTEFGLDRHISIIHSVLELAAY